MRSIMVPMRTILTLDGEVLKRARKKAAEENRPLKEVINEALRLGLDPEQGRRRPPFKFRIKTVKGRLMSWVDLTDRDKLFDLMDGR